MESYDQNHGQHWHRGYSDVEDDGRNAAHSDPYRNSHRHIQFGDRDGSQGQQRPPTHRPDLQRNYKREQFQHQSYIDDEEHFHNAAHSEPYLTSQRGMQSGGCGSAGGRVSGQGQQRPPTIGQNEPWHSSTYSDQHMHQSQHEVRPQLARDLFAAGISEHNEEVSKMMQYNLAMARLRFAENMSK